jgi:hypothetical protein
MVTEGQVVAVDGKTLRRSHDRTLGKAVIQMVSAWATANRLILGQIKVDDQSVVAGRRSLSGVDRPSQTQACDLALFMWLRWRGIASPGPEVTQVSDSCQDMIMHFPQPCGIIWLKLFP